jgi:hypothetical protein
MIGPQLRSERHSTLETTDERLTLDDEALTVRRQCSISPPVYLPTRAQIRAACRQIRASWSPAEERSRRAIGRRVAWTVPDTRIGLLVIPRENSSAFG